MNRLPLILAILTLAATPRPVTLQWDYDPNAGVPDTFTLYGTTNVALPLTNWMVLTNVSGTSRECTVTLTPNRYFFTLTASNIWSVSEPSNTASVPGPTGTNKLTIGR